MTQLFEGQKSSIKVFASSILGNIKYWATLSNCGDPLKPLLPSWRRKTVSGRANSPGYGKNVKDVTMGNPQPSPKGVITYGCSSTTRRQWVLYKNVQCLRYSLLLCESKGIKALKVAKCLVI